MKAILISLILLVASFQAISQCDKKVKWYASKGEMFDTNGTLLDTKYDSIILETDPQKITLTFKSGAKAFGGKPLEAIVTEKSCHWKEPFRNGQTVYHGTVSLDGSPGNATFTIESIDQKITLSLSIEARKERKFLIYIDRYEEVK